MTARHQISRAALELIERFEGYRRKAARLADGRWTIGYGHTLTAREGAEVSRDDAEALLIYDVRPVAAAVNELTYTPLTQNQFDALVAFAFNIGIDNFRRSSVLRRVNEGSLIQAAGALEMWRKADFEGERIVVDALVRRRAAEKTLFLTPPGGFIPAPSPVLQPKIDYEIGQTLPQDATELETPLTGDRAEAHRTAAEPSVEGSASLAAAEAVSARLNEILPETVPTETTPGPEAEAAYYAAAAVSAPILEPQVAKPGARPEPEIKAEPSVTPAQAIMVIPAEPLFFSDEDPAKFKPPIAPPLARREPTLDVRFGDPEEPANLSRRVMWREAPEPQIPRVSAQDWLSRINTPMLAVLLVLGLGFFAGAVVLSLNPKGSVLLSWALGLVGIACAVSAVYLYLDRLGGREE